MLQQMVLPERSVIVTMVLLNVAKMCAIPCVGVSFFFPRVLGAGFSASDAQSPVIPVAVYVLGSSR